MYHDGLAAKSMVELNISSIDEIAVSSTTSRTPETRYDRPEANVPRVSSYGYVQGPNTLTNSLSSLDQRSTRGAVYVQPLSITLTTTLPIARDIENSQLYMEVGSAAEMMYNTKINPPRLRGGTMLGFIEYLTQNDSADPQVQYTFLLTYRSFTTGQELFNLLRDRWKLQLPCGLSKHGEEPWLSEKQTFVRLRITSIIKVWLDDFWMETDVKANQQLLTKIMRFSNDMVRPVSPSQAICLEMAIEQRKVHNNKQTPIPMAPANVEASSLTPQKLSKRIQILRTDKKEFAEQLTIIDSELFRKVTAGECLWKTWPQLDGEFSCTESVRALILHCNKLSNWIARTILEQQDSKRQAEVIAHCVILAERCRTLDNFSSLTSILAGLGTTSIRRLSTTWSKVSTSTTTSLESMRKLMSSTGNFEAYRETLRNTTPPCVPFLGVYLADLKYIESGIPSTLQPRNLINYTKLSKFAAVIREMNQNQRAHYSLRPMLELKAMIVREIQSTADPIEMHAWSMSVGQHVESSESSPARAD